MAFPGAHEWIEHVAHGASAIPGIGRLLKTILPTLLDILAGVVAGGVVLAVITLASLLLSDRSEQH